MPDEKPAVRYERVTDVPDTDAKTALHIDAPATSEIRVVKWVPIEELTDRAAGVAVQED